MRLMLLICAAVLAAGGTGFYLFQELLLSQPVQVAPTAAVAPTTTTDVYVAAFELQVGALIVPADLRKVPMPKGLVTPEMVKANKAGLEILTGSVVRSVLPKGVPVALSSTVQPGERGFLAAVLPEGKRAVSVYISEVGGISGLILPGDRVDVILTYTVTGGTGDYERDIHASETVLKNLRVLALDQRLGPMPQKEDSKGKFVPPPIARMVTLQVSSDEAEVLTLATQLGELALVLNSVRDGGEPQVAAADTVIADILEPMLRTGPVDRVNSSARPEERGLTLDSDVTSLLQRRAEVRNTAVASDAPITESDRTNRVQVVRGTTSNAVRVGALLAEDAAAAQEAPAQPTAD